VLSLGYPDGLSAEDLLGSDLLVVDIKAHMDVEVMADLNNPHALGEFDLVLDPGTCEHCANPGQALRTALEAVRVGGHIVQTVPLTMVNHGFWNYGPQLIPAIYAANGFALERFEVYTLSHDPVPVDSITRRMHLPPDCWALVVGERKERPPWTWPIQELYA
jgi:SAM-dependent methyltransferase